MSRDITDPERRWLAGEIEAWRGLGLVSLDQAKSILALYATSQENFQRRQPRSPSIDTARRS